MDKIRNIIDIVDPPITILEEIMWQKSLFDHLFLQLSNLLAVFFQKL